jgi:hypothetical protein
VFEPLLLEEAGAQVLRGIEEGVVIEPHESVVAACSKVGSCNWRLLPMRLQRQPQPVWQPGVLCILPGHLCQHSSSSMAAARDGHTG